MSFRFTIICLSALLLLGSGLALAEDKAPENRVLIKNVRVFDGVKDGLSRTTNVLVTGNKISSVSPDAEAGEGATVIDGGGRVLMPGLADTHVHLAYATISELGVLAGLPSYAFIRSSKDAEAMLMRGVTVARDMGGEVFGLKQAIDEGLVAGPRIYPSGATISQTAGHGDPRFPNERHPRFGGHLSPAFMARHFFLADGVPEVLAAARENLRLGASQIKVMAGGGYSSPSDPIMGIQYTSDEIKAAVDVAQNWQTYVTIHSYHPAAINQAIDAGVMDVGHGQLLDEATLKKMADKGVYLSTQPFTVCNEPQLSEFSNEKLAIVCKGTEYVYKTAKKIKNLKVTYGTDIFFNPEMFADQVKMMERLLPWFEPVEILRMATGNTTELWQMSGIRNPYPDGELGVVREGAYADLLLVEGNPLEDLGAVTDHDNLLIIMKDGKIYKNKL